MAASSDLRMTPQHALVSGRVDHEKGQQHSALHYSLPPDNFKTHPRWGLRAAWSSIRMPSFRQCLITFLIAACLTTAYARIPIHLKQSDIALSGPGDDSAFQELLSQVSDASLHEVLHDVSDKYKHGVYPQDRTALEAIHKDNPAMATSLVKLARRQNSTFTTTEPVTSTDTVVVVPPDSTSTIVVSVSPTQVPPTQGPTTDTSGQTTPAQPPPGSQPTTLASIAPKTTATGAGVATATGKATVGAGSSSASGAASVHSSGSNSGPTSAGGSSVTTSSPGSGSGSSSGSGLVTAKTSSTEQLVWTTTLPNGSRSTVTSFTIVPAGEQASTPGSAPSITGTPSLQNGAMEMDNPRSRGAWGALLATFVLVMGVL